jgi:hypothetical protein
MGREGWGRKVSHNHAPLSSHMGDLLGPVLFLTEQKVLKVQKDTSKKNWVNNKDRISNIWEWIDYSVKCVRIRKWLIDIAMNAEKVILIIKICHI